MDSTEYASMKGCSLVYKITSPATNTRFPFQGKHSKKRASGGRDGAGNHRHDSLAWNPAMPELRYHRLGGLGKEEIEERS